MILEDLEWGLFEDSMVVGITKHIQVLLFTCAKPLSAWILGGFSALGLSEPL